MWWHSAQNIVLINLEHIDLKNIQAEHYLDRLNCELREKLKLVCQDGQKHQSLRKLSQQQRRMNYGHGAGRYRCGINARIHPKQPRR